MKFATELLPGHQGEAEAFLTRKELRGCTPDWEK